MHIIKKIEKNLNIIKNSTRRNLLLKGEGYHFDRLNSEYTSHKRYKFTKGHDWWGGLAIIFSNPEYPLYVMAYNVYTDKDKTCGLEGQFQERIISSSFFEGMFPFPANIPDWLNSGVVRVIIPDQFSGFDTDGNPLYQNEGKIMLWWHHRGAYGTTGHHLYPLNPKEYCLGF